MIEPYLTHVKHAINTLPGSPFVIRRDDDYVLEASNSILPVRFLVEGPVESAISIALLDKNGNLFDVSLLEHLLDPKRLGERRKRLRNILDEAVGQGSRRKFK